MDSSMDTGLADTSWQSLLPIMPRAKKVAAETPPSTEDTAPKFTLFNTLPPELRLLIWRHAIVPRIVDFKPGNLVPGVAHVCQESRRETQYFFKARDYMTGIYMNPQLDILHLDESSFSKELAYHNSAYHTLRCREISCSMLKPVERVAFSVQELLAMWKMECFHCFLSNRLSYYFPNIKE